MQLQLQFDQQMQFEEEMQMMMNPFIAPGGMFGSLGAPGFGGPMGPGTIGLGPGM